MGTQTDLRREIVKAFEKRKCLFIVEGYDDPSFFEGLFEKIAEDDSYIVKEVAIFGQGSGCTVIVEQFKEYQTYLNQNEELLRYVRGIIDADVFDFCATPEEQQERENMKGLFSLKYYSYESHALTQKNIEKVFLKLTNFQKSCFDAKTKNHIHRDIEDKVIKQMYYVGLECLKKAKIEGYESVFSYGDKEENISEYNYRNYRINRQINKEELDQFANEQQLNYSLENVKKIVKGKHLMLACADEISYLLSQLNHHCQKNECNDIECAYMETCATKDEIGDSIPCYWNNKYGYSKTQIYNELIQQYDLDEFTYLIEELRNTAIKFKQ